MDNPVVHDVEALSQMGYQRPAQVIAAVRAWHRGRYPAVRSEKVRERLTVADVPEPFKGPAIGMITAGLMSLAFMGFAGLV